ncbi:MAG: hypothetical protein RMM98_10795 [Acidobacteriota bacterium]|nr:hypothetical protein [Blastocatellia bacterium]MDW8240094.1 hypothetical protein [Acidobacteriota bacterium]
MTERERLQAIAGVWLGTYTHLTPDGTVLDRYTSRQECRLEGDQWYERIIYRVGTDEQQTFDFRARFVGEELVFEDAQLHGQTTRVSDDVSIFDYYWKDRPHIRIVETIVVSRPDRKSRIWQTFEHGQLVKVTIIDERRSDEQPAIWY